MVDCRVEDVPPDTEFEIDDSVTEADRSANPEYLVADVVYSVSEDCWGYLIAYPSARELWFSSLDEAHEEFERA